MKLVVGLGNPGDQYRSTYHNIGFDAVDKFASRFSAPDFAFDKKSNSLLTDIIIRGERVMVCKPQTFMNLSGGAVDELSRYFKIEPQNILVAYDDIDIAKGTVRARLSGSAGTHNGMRDIVYQLGSTEFARVRIGTGIKPAFMALASYVLSRIPEPERALMDKACAAACDYIEDWAAGKTWNTLTTTVTE